MKRSTITDVAELAGVSIKTVSRVVNREPNVREPTRAKVMEAIETLHYRPSQSARSLAGNRSYLLALLYDNPSASYVTNVQNGLLETCRANHYDLLIHPCDYKSPDLKREVWDLVRNAGVDGLVLTPPVTDCKEVINLLKRLETPYALISPPRCGRKSMAVCTNDREVCGEMVRYLVSLGHRRIAFIQGHPDHLAIANRFEGYLEGMAQAGLKPARGHIVQGFNSFESGVECGRKLLELKSPPTAIFSSNDDMAAGVLHAAHQMGVSVPGSLSVAGFDDIPLSSYVWPPLTTIRQHIRAMGKQAAELLIRHLGNQPTEHLDRVIESKIVIRDSTGPAPR